MDVTGSFLKTVIARARGYVDAVATDAKYTDDFIVRHIIQPATVDVLSRINITQDNPIVNRFTIALAAGTSVYLMPPCVQEVWRIVRLDESLNILADYVPRNHFHRMGPNWSLEGNTLRWWPKNDEAFTVTVFYISNGDVAVHYASTGATYGANTITFPATPTLGEVDRRPNAYVGQVVRTLPLSGGLREERIVTAYDASTRTATVNINWTSTPATNTPYEVAPYASQPLYEAVSCGAAMKLAAYANISDSHQEKIANQYRGALKTVRDNLSTMNMRQPKGFEKNTVDNPNLLLVPYRYGFWNTYTNP